jgi:hypothetical protein
MNGDLTRDTFDPRRGFTAVRAQQGRVMLDADHNEQADIERHDTRQGRQDIVGEAGAPADAPGFGITLAAGQPVLGAGRYVVRGIRVQNDADQQLATGPPFLAGNTLPTTAGTWLAYLEVWERPLTAVEEPSIREVALGGPDTTLRDQLVWQVRWHRIGDVGLATSCASGDTALEALGELFDGTLEPGLEAGSGSGPCIVSDAAQFRGLENQLYRVEIHHGNVNGSGASTGTGATFKWSRDNGAIVAGVVGLTSTAPIVLQVERLGPGGAAGFDRGVTIEIRNESSTLTGVPGILARIDDVEGDSLHVTLLDGATVPALQSLLGGSRVIVRRWDSNGAQAITGTFTSLEDGIQVRFMATGRYRSGDFWLIPARTASIPGTTSQIEWPLTSPGASTYVPLRSRGPVRHRAGLAILERAAEGAWSLRSDCRQIFPPLTSILTLTPAGGDGQHARSGEWLPSPISVVVTRGRIPVPGIRVQFRVASGGGVLSLAPPSAPAPAALVTTSTDANGRAIAHWRLGTGPARRVATVTWEPSLAQSVEVMCIGSDGTAAAPALLFVAQTLDHFNLHIAGGNGQQGRPGELLEVALRVRVDDGERAVENAVVQFSVLSRLLEGARLDQETGGTVHASARFVSGDVWPNSTRFHTVRTTTDAEGVAQVQWTLGTQIELTTQRVEARLLGTSGGRTDQAALFIAQLALAGEIRWQPLVPWLAALLNGATATVQGAIDAIAQRVDRLAATSTAFDPFLGAQWRATSGAFNPLGPATTIPVNQFAAVVLRSDLVPSTRDVNAVTLHSGVRVYAELPAPGGGEANVVNITGSFGRVAGRWEWALSSQGRGALNRALVAAGPGRPVPLLVTVVPRWLPGGQAIDSSVRHELLFNVTP